MNELDICIPRMYLHTRNERSRPNIQNLEREQQDTRFSATNLDLNPITLIWELYLKMLKLYAYMYTKNDRV